MDVPWDVVLSTTGGIAAAVVGVLVGGLVSRRSQNLTWLRDNQAAAYAAVLREYARVEVDLRSAYYRDEPPRVDWAPWGASLAALSLVCSPEVSSVTARLSEAVISFETFVLGGRRPDDTGLDRVTADLAAAQMEFVNAARRALERTQRPLAHRLGGPPRLQPPAGN